MRRWGPALGLGMLLAGCMGQPRPADLDAGVGRWTKAETLERLGPPAERIARDGEETWVYAGDYAIGFGSPYQVDPLEPTIAGGGGVPVGQDVRDTPRSSALRLERRFLLHFDADGVLPPLGADPPVTEAPAPAEERFLQGPQERRYELLRALRIFAAPADGRADRLVSLRGCRQIHERVVSLRKRMPA